MSININRIIAGSAYKIIDELNDINVVMCAQGYFKGEKINDEDIDKMLLRLCPPDFIDSEGEIQRQEGLEYIKRVYFLEE